jgi:hypothetical protein
MYFLYRGFTEHVPGNSLPMSLGLIDFCGDLKVAIYFGQRLYMTIPYSSATGSTVNHDLESAKRARRKSSRYGL